MSCYLGLKSKNKPSTKLEASNSFFNAASKTS